MLVQRRYHLILKVQSVSQGSINYYNSMGGKQEPQIIPMCIKHHDSKESEGSPQGAQRLDPNLKPKFTWKDHCSTFHDHPLGPVMDIQL